MDINNYLDHDYHERLFKLQIQDNNRGGRSLNNVQRHVNWISDNFLSSLNGNNVLDLGCGLGHYSYLLSTKGLNCIGLDVSREAIGYANSHYSNPTCKFLVSDILKAEFPRNNNSLTIFTYSTFNIFSKSEGKNLLKKIYDALNPGGWLYFETLDYPAPQESTSCFAKFRAPDPFYCEHNSILLHESEWNAEQQVQIFKNYFIDLETFAVSSFKGKLIIYTKQQYIDLLEEVGFSAITFYSTPPGTEEDKEHKYFFISAKKLCQK